MIGTSDGLTYEDRFDYLANEPMGGSMPKQQTAPNTIDSFTPAQPKIEFNRDIEPDGPMPIPESKDAALGNTQLAMDFKKTGQGKLPEGVPKGGEPGGGGESISSAALKMPDGTIRTGNTHFDIVGKMEKVDWSKVQDGFMTSTGRFVSRGEAAEIHFGKPSPKTPNWTDIERNLTSEDLGRTRVKPLFGGEWRRNREMYDEGLGSTSTFGVPNAPISPQYDALPSSKNVEDRTHDPEWPKMFQAFTGLWPDEAAAMIKNPLTPIHELFPDRYLSPEKKKEEFVQTIPRAPKGSLAAQLGLNDTTDLDRLINTVEERDAFNKAQEEKYEQSRKEMDELIARTEKRLEDIQKELDRQAKKTRRK